MRQLTTQEILYTAFRKRPQDDFKSVYGYTHPERDKNDMCPYCKNEDTDVVRDSAYLKQFDDIFSSEGVKGFRVLSCYCCGAVFSVVW